MRFRRSASAAAMALCCVLSAGSGQVSAAAVTGGAVLPGPDQPFTGKIGRTYADSMPANPGRVTAPKDAPNVLVILTDDVGFGAASTFGGPIPTPNLDRLAERGLKYNRFHTTAMCSPTRAALLTGRNHHAAGSGIVTDLAAGYPGYTGIIPRSTATVAEVLKRGGYNTAMFGKHHNVQPGATSPAGPFDQWPTGLGFEYFYGFVAAETDQFTPALYRGITPVKAPEGKMLDEMLVDDAIRWMHNQQAAAPDKPFFMYLATGSLHAPHQAPKEWIRKFRGQFDHGWDKVREDIYARQKKLGVVPASTVLPPRPETIPAWNSISEARRKTSARMMEVAAAMLAYQDDQFGRLINELERTGELENTLVLFIEGDNGSSAEGSLFGHTNPMGGFANNVVETEDEQLARIDELGSAETTQNWAAGWAWATSTPFKWTKSYASHLGGVRNGLVVSWRAQIKERGIRPQFHHLVDIAPTILEAAGLPAPIEVNGVKQKPLDGVSMSYSFTSPALPSKRRTQYFEMLGNRAIYHDGWWAGTTPQRVSWRSDLPKFEGTPDNYGWELYNIDQDFSQSKNLATSHPEKLAELKTLFDKEAERNSVFPLDDRLDLARFAGAVALGAKPRPAYVYWGKDISLPVEVAPRLVGNFSLEAQIETQPNATDGVLAALGGKHAGWSFYLKDGKPVVTMAGANQPSRVFRVEGSERVPTGAATVRYDFASEGPGKGGLMRIRINGREVGQGRIEQTVVRLVEMSDTLDIGFDGATPVTHDYEGEGRFSGEIRKLVINTPGVVAAAR